MREQWKSVKGFEGLYEISELGNVRRVCPHLPIKGAKAGAGYLKVNLWKRGKQLQAYIHILVMKHFGPPQPEGYEVDHVNGDKLDNRIENLQWISHAENCSRAYSVNGVPYSGIARQSTRLDMEKASQIRTAYSLGFKVMQLARAYRVSHGTICNIVHNKTWINPSLRS